MYEKGIPLRKKDQEGYDMNPLHDVSHPPVDERVDQAQNPYAIPPLPPPPSSNHASLNLIPLYQPIPHHRAAVDFNGSTLHNGREYMSRDESLMVVPPSEEEPQPEDPVFEMTELSNRSQKADVARSMSLDISPRTLIATPEQEKIPLLKSLTCKEQRLSSPSRRAWSHECGDYDDITDKKYGGKEETFEDSFLQLDRLVTSWWSGLDMRIIVVILIACLVLIGSGFFSTVSKTNILSTSETIIWTGEPPLVTNFEGWGTSLAWWAEFLGTLEPDRQNIVLNMVFSNSSKESLKMNMVRFNIGGSGPHNFTTGKTPSDPKLMEWRGVPSLLDQNGVYNWTADQAQVNVMIRAKELGVNIFEAFSNSPPWFMTISKSSRGHPSGQDNLDRSNYTAFADYLATVVKESSTRWGIDFGWLEPFNEPNSEWWKSTSSIQEGCAFSPASQTAFLPFLVDAMKRHGIWNKTKISVADAWSIEAALRNLNEGANFDHVEKVNVHGYGYAHGVIEMNAEWWNTLKANFRARVPDRIHSVWMSEVGGFGFGSGALTKLSVSIIHDLNILRSTAWIWWQVVDPAPSWALVVVSSRWPWWVSRWNYYPKRTLSFYVLQQFSAHIRPGDMILSSSRANYTGICIVCVVVSYSPSEKRMTIVVVNTSDKPVQHQLTVAGRNGTDMTMLANENNNNSIPNSNDDPSGPRVREAYRTCDWTQEYHQEIRLPRLGVNKKNQTTLNVNLIAFSVTTFIIQDVMI